MIAETSQPGDGESKIAETIYFKSDYKPDYTWLKNLTDKEY